MVAKSTILGLIASLTVILIVVSMTENDSTKDITTIVTVEESGVSQACVETGCYTPNIAHVQKGSTITMKNTDPYGVHTFTSGTIDDSVPSPDGMFDSGILMIEDSYERKFSTVGMYDYYCTLHTWMTGQIIVN